MAMKDDVTSGIRELPPDELDLVSGGDGAKPAPTPKGDIYLSLPDIKGESLDNHLPDR
jgi:hypothetical protein